MNINIKRIYLILLIFIIYVFISVSLVLSDPSPYVDYLSPPSIKSPIYEGAEVVEVAYYEPYAEIEIFADNVEKIGEGSFWFGRGTFKLTRKLVKDEKITATQTINGDTSYPTWDAIIVEKLPADILNKEELDQPIIITPLYDCQRIVPVKKLIEGAEIKVYSNGKKIGSTLTAHSFANIGTRMLKENDIIKVNQTICGQFESPTSSEVKVEGLPDRISTPIVREDTLKDGGNTVIVDNLTTGTIVKIISNGANEIGSGIAPGPSVIFRVNPPLEKGALIMAKQFLCDLPSQGSFPKSVKNTLHPPKIQKPICEGSNNITICNTVPNAVLKTYVNGKQAGQGGSIGNCTPLPLGDRINLKDGDKIYATQTYGSLTSNPSDFVIVNRDYLIEVDNGHPFFKPEKGNPNNEQAIPAPVFLRGIYTNGTNGPLFRASMCGIQEAVVNIISPKGDNIKEIILVESKPGLFEGEWDWTSSGWNSPNDIPVGEYKARFEVISSELGTKTEEKIFYVIFNPDEVNAPSPFTFNETGIWFGCEKGKIRCLLYDLHPDDNRIFGKAIQLINGETSAYEAGKKIMQWLIPAPFTFDCKFCLEFVWDDEKEKNICVKLNPNYKKPIGDLPPDKRWRYSTCTSEKDTIDLLNRPDKAAQCADSANLYTAMLRGVGIPAHPTTADADYKEDDNGGTAIWLFDTWTEVLLNGPDGIKWYAAHPHEGHFFTIRPSAGSWRVASEYKNDVIVMANENWPKGLKAGSLVAEFEYNTVCKNPDKKILKLPWIEHLCLKNPTGEGYWGKGHWECSPPFSSSINVTLDSEKYFAGDVIHISINITNSMEEQIESHLIVDMVIDDIKTKTIDERINILEKNVVVNSQSNEIIETTYELPLDIFSDNVYSIHVKFSDEYAIQYFLVLPLFETEVILPNRVEEGEIFNVNLTIFNFQNIVLEDIYADLILPFQVGTLEEQPNRQISQLEPGNNKTIVWQLFGLSFADAAQLQFSITSENSGNTNIFEGIEILPEHIKDPVITYTPLYPKAKFELSNLIIPSKIREGETMIIKIDVSNIGEAKGSTNISLKINNVVIEVKQVTLDVSETKTVEFIHIAEDEPRTYSVEIDGKTGEYKVTPGFEFIFTIVGLLIMTYIFRRRNEMKKS